MRLCFSTLACPDWTLEQIIEAAVRHGIEGIDFRGIGSQIDITQMVEFGAELPATLEQLRRHGLSMPCLNTSVTLVCPDAGRWQTMLDECHRYASLASKTGTTWLRVFGGKVPQEMKRDEACAMAQRHLRQVSKICRSSGCKPLLETHDAWSTSEQVLELVHEFDPAEAGVLWDMEHPWRQGEPLTETANRLQRYLEHVHVKDGAHENGQYHPRLLGEGQLPLEEFTKVLKGTGYDGWICLETEKRWHRHGPEPEQSVPQFAKVMRQLWESAPTAHGR